MKKAILLAGAVLVGFSAYLQTEKPANYETGKKVYQQACMACHMADGNGIAGLNPPLAGTDWVTGDKKRLINVILKGLDKPIVVNGEEYVVPMPGQPQLSDVQIADVLTYIRNSFGNKASAVTPAEVKALRSAK